MSSSKTSSKPVWNVVDDTSSVVSAPRVPTEVDLVVEGLNKCLVSTVEKALQKLKDSLNKDSYLSDGPDILLKSLCHSLDVAPDFGGKITGNRLDDSHQDDPLTLWELIDSYNDRVHVMQRRPELAHITSIQQIPAILNAETQELVNDLLEENDPSKAESISSNLLETSQIPTMRVGIAVRQNTTNDVHPLAKLVMVYTSDTERYLDAMSGEEQDQFEQLCFQTLGAGTGLFYHSLNDQDKDEDEKVTTSYVRVFCPEHLSDQMYKDSRRLILSYIRHDDEWTQVRDWTQPASTPDGRSFVSEDLTGALDQESEDEYSGSAEDLEKAGSDDAGPSDLSPRQLGKRPVY